MLRLIRHLDKFRRDTRGVAAIWATLLAIIIFTLTALAVDGSWIYFNRSRLQATADASVLAAAGTPDDYITAANNYAELNMPAANNGDVLADVDIEDGTWDSDTRTFDPAGTPVDAYRVTTRRATANGNALPLFFAQILGDSETNLSMSAVATAQKNVIGSGPVCILTLSELELAQSYVGNVTVNVESCSIMSNSTGDPSIKQTGSSEVTADCVYAAGEIQDKSINTLSCDEPTSGVDPVLDPYADLEVPETLPACAAVPDWSGDITLDPGTYCEIGHIDGSVYFNPGTYYFTDDVNINAGAELIGTDVTIVLTDEASPSSNTLFINGGATVQLSAPSTGDYAGVLIYQDRNIDWPDDPPSTINGNSESDMTGAIYFPNSGLRINGTGDVSDDEEVGCLQIIAYTIVFAGDATVGGNCEGTGVEDIEITSGLVFSLVD